MISEEIYLQVPFCDLCKNKGRYNLRCRTAEQQDEYGIPPGEIITIKCGNCRVNTRRRQEFVKNQQFEDPIRYYEISDYEKPDVSQSFLLKKTEDALSMTEEIIGDVETELVKRGGFTYLSGESNSGKTVLSHIIARHAYAQGVMVNRVSIPELSVMLSHKIHGRTARDGDEIVFDLDDYLDVDVLIVEEFELINSYFNYANVRRSLIYNIFSGRLKSGKPTIVISKLKLSEMFSEEKQKASGFPNDFPSIIVKSYRTLELHGRFKKEKGKAGTK